MKTYVSPKELRLVGKAYEIRRHLRTLLERTSNPHEALGSRLAQWSGFKSPVAADSAHTSDEYSLGCRIFPFPTR